MVENNFSPPAHTIIYNTIVRKVIWPIYIQCLLTVIRKSKKWLQYEVNNLFITIRSLMNNGIVQS